MQTCWFDNRLYVLANFCPGDRSVPSSVFFSVFDVKAQKWTELRIGVPNFAEDNGYLKFNISRDGVITILHHVEAYDGSELTHTDVHCYRFSLM
jgi:hypothetical protein